MDKDIILDFFFEAMLKGGYLSGAKPTPVLDMPRYKEFTWYRVTDQGTLRMQDRFCTRPDSRYSAGLTTIWLSDLPLFFMSYGGFYEEEAIPLLKEALREVYETKRFYGGRGFPAKFGEGHLEYRNISDYTVGNSRFRGREEITNLDTDQLLGYHEYMGLFLV